MPISEYILISKKKIISKEEFDTLTESREFKIRFLNQRITVVDSYFLRFFSLRETSSEVRGVSRTVLEMKDWINSNCEDLVYFDNENICFTFFSIQDMNLFVLKYKILE